MGYSPWGHKESDVTEPLTLLCMYPKAGQALIFWNDSSLKIFYYFLPLVPTFVNFFNDFSSGFKATH